MRIAEEHPGVFVTRDYRYLRDVQPKLKEARDGLMTKVVEAKVRQASAAPEPLPSQPEAIRSYREG